MEYLFFVAGYLFGYLFAGHEPRASLNRKGTS